MAWILSTVVYYCEYTHRRDNPLYIGLYGPLVFNLHCASALLARRLIGLR